LERIRDIEKGCSKRVAFLVGFIPFPLLLWLHSPVHSEQIHLDIAVDVCPNEKSIDQITTLTFDPPLEDGRIEFLLDAGLDVQSVSVVNSAPALVRKVDRPDGYSQRWLAVLPDTQSVRSVRIFSSGRLASKRAIMRSGFVLLSSSLDTKWFPLPDKGSVFTASVQALLPLGWEAVSNGFLAGRSADQKHSVYNWESATPLEDLSLVASANYVRICFAVKDVGVCVYTFDKPDSIFGETIVSELERLIPFSQHVYGKLPVSHLNFVEVGAEFPGGIDAFAERGLMVLASHLRGRTDEYIARRLVHELAHQWWGLTVKYSEEDWAFFREGFAVYLEYLYLRDFLQDDESASNFRILLFSDYLTTIRTLKEKPLSELEPDELIATPLVYRKAPLLITSLEGLVGRDEFIGFLRDYVVAHHDEPATVDDFSRGLSLVTGRKLNWFFDDYYRSTATHNSSIDGFTFDQDDQGFLSVVKVSFSGEGRFPMPLLLQFSREESQRRTVEGRAVLSFRSTSPPIGVHIDPAELTMDNFWIDNHHPAFYFSKMSLARRIDHSLPSHNFSWGTNFFRHKYVRVAPVIDYNSIDGSTPGLSIEARSSLKSRTSAWAAFAVDTERVRFGIQYVDSPSISSRAYAGARVLDDGLRRGGGFLAGFPLVGDRLYTVVSADYFALYDDSREGFVREQGKDLLELGATFTSPILNVTVLHSTDRSFPIALTVKGSSSSVGSGYDFGKVILDSRFSRRPFAWRLRIGHSWGDVPDAASFRLKEHDSYVSDEDFMLRGYDERTCNGFALGNLQVDFPLTSMVMPSAGLDVAGAWTDESTLDTAAGISLGVRIDSAILEGLRPATFRVEYSFPYDDFESGGVYARFWDAF
jgi:hypothetical protein